MTKFINCQTGLEVPVSEVREITPGSRIFVHVSTVFATPISAIIDPESTSQMLTPYARRVVDSYVAAIADDATYNPTTDNPIIMRFAR